MKKILVLLIALIALSGQVGSAQTLTSANTSVTQTKTNWDMSVTVGMYDHYLSSAGGVEFYDDPVVQTDVRFINKPTGFYVGVWWDTGLNTQFNNIGTFDDEIDIFVGVHRPLGLWGLEYNLEANYFNEPGLGVFGRGDVLYTGVALNRPFVLAGGELSLNPHVSFDRYTAIPRSGFTGDTLVIAGVGATWQISRILSLQTDFSGVHDFGGFGFVPEGNSLRVFSDLHWQVSKVVSINAPTVRHWARFSDYLPPQTVFGASINFTFGLK